MSKTIKDYYTILGVSPNATQEQIRLAYRQMARTHHPDLNNEPDAEERFKEINEAYEILADPQKRKSYDFFVGATEMVTPAPPPPPPPRPGGDFVEPPVEPAPAPSSQTPSSPPQTPPPVVTPAPQKPPQSRQRIYPPTWAILLIMVGACIILGVGGAAVASWWRTPTPSGGAESLSVAKLTTFTSPPKIPADLTVVSESGSPLLMVRPNRADVAGRVFDVVPVLPQAGRWPVPEKDTGVGAWIHGTVINYVIGVPYTTTNETLLAGLDSGDRITLTLGNGTVLVFGSPQTQRIAADDLSPMAQNTPGITLVMLGNDQTNRLVVQARYLPEESLASEDQRIEGVRIQVLDAAVANEADGSLFFVVEYTITNESTVSVDPAFFDMVLQDNDEQRYTLNEEATSWGEYGTLEAPLPPGTSAGGSAGYVVPREMESPLTWIFRLDATSAEAARFVLSYEPPAPSPALPYVEAYDAFYDARRDVIVIEGEIFNDGESPLTVTLEDITLSSNQGESTMQAATPLLPWTVNPEGSSITFELQFARPENVDSVLLDILGFTFRLEGLLD